MWPHVLRSVAIPLAAWAWRSASSVYRLAGIGGASGVSGAIGSLIHAVLIREVPHRVARQAR